MGGVTSKPEDICLHQNERAGSRTGESGSRKARNKVRLTSPWAAGGWFHPKPEAVLGLVAGVLGTKSKWFCFTKRVRNQIPAL